MTADLRTGALLDLVRQHAARLADAGIATPMPDASALAAHALGIGRAEVRIRDLADVDPAALDRFAELVARRARRVPLQHLTGRVGFRTLTLECRPGVFVPRPETEVLAGLAIDLARPGAVVVEPCTGTGAVAASIAAEAAGVTVVATDRDPAAVDLARRNVAQLGLDVEVLHGDLLQPLGDALRGRVDVLVANPPYLTPRELVDCEPEVREHDPAAALVAGATGHEVTDRLIAASGRWLRPGGALLLEVAEVRASEVADRARAAGLQDVEVTGDLAGRERVVVAEVAGP